MKFITIAIMSLVGMSAIAAIPPEQDFAQTTHADCVAPREMTVRLRVTGHSTENGYEEYITVAGEGGFTRDLVRSHVYSHQQETYEGENLKLVISFRPGLISAALESRAVALPKIFHCSVLKAD